MKELFEKVYIKSEDDLPKDNIQVFAFNEETGKGFFVTVNPLDPSCLTDLFISFNWYLKPLEAQKGHLLRIGY